MSFRLVLDPIACAGHGLCAELYPEGITLDDWGFPIVLRGPVAADHEPHARRAVDACPELALAISREDKADGRRARGTPTARRR
jgi:ferredoxin